MKVVEEALAADGMIGLIMIKNEFDKPKADDLHLVGTAAKIVKRINLPDGGSNIYISTMKRFRVKKFLAKESPIVAAVD